MVVITVNVIDSQVTPLLKAINESDLVKVIHRSDIKTYLKGDDGNLYAQDEEKLSFYTNNPDDIDKIVDVIKTSTTDKFLGLSVNGEIEGEQLKKVLSHDLTPEEFKELTTDAVKVRF